MPKRKDKPHNGKLDFRKQRFVDAYVTNGFREAKAAIEAGYSAKSAYSQASRLLKDEKIQAAINDRMEQLVMSRQETLYRLSEHGRGDMRKFIGLSSDEIKEHPQGWLIKKYKNRITRHEDYNVEYIEIELQDPQSAITTIAKHQGLLKDGSTININIELIQQTILALEAAGISPSDVFQGLINKAKAKIDSGS